MRYLICFLILVFSVGVCGADNVATSRRLLAQLDGESVPKVRIGLYRDLADLWFEQPQERTYLKKILELGKGHAEPGVLSEALFDLAHAHIKNNQPDSARYYMQQLDKHPETEALTTFLSIKLFDLRINNSDATEKEIGLPKELQDDKSSIYSRIHDAYTTGNSFYVLSRPSEALPRMQQAYDLSLQLPDKQGHELRNLTAWVLANIHKALGDREKYIEIIQRCIEEDRRYFAAYCKDRTYYPTAVFELSYYSSLLSCIDLLPEQTVERYVDQIRGMTDLYSPSDKFNRAWALNQYCMSKDRRHESLALIDSMTIYARSIKTSYMPGLLKMKSQVYDRMGDYKAALRELKQMIRLEDSLQMQEQQMQIDKLKAQYEVDKLSYDNNRLQVTRKRMQSIILIIIISAIFLLCGYLYYNLRRERKIQRELDILRANAEKSEQEKTAFINHICHEIRTPLNAISGFSQVIADTSTDEESKTEFAGLIETNKAQLTSLIEHLLTVSQLDSPDGQLLGTPIDIAAICRREFDKAVVTGAVSFRSEIPDSPLPVPGNEKYLSLLVGNLLSNAVKFTSKGEIALSLTALPECIRITVTDTGCGIPEESREKVFERFVKLDRFTIGNGLGLYLCRLIATRLGGTIAIDPEYGPGTRMVVELPSEQDEDTTAASIFETYV